MMIFKRILIASFLFLSSIPVFALNYTFLGDAPAANMTSEDWGIFSSTADRALNKAHDGVKVVWKNPHTGATGYFIPVSTTHRDGMLCRQLIIYENARGYTNKSTYVFCKTRMGWKTA